MTTTVFLVRHGAHGQLGHALSGRTPGLGLTEDGRAGATRTARRLAGRNVAAVYTSPLQRAGETAAIIAGGLGLQPAVAEALTEINFGDWTGLAFDALAYDPAWRRWNEVRSQHRPPQGESMLQVQIRLSDWLWTVHRLHPDAAVVAVSHADVIKSALAYALGLSADAHARFAVDPASVSSITVGEWGMTVLSMNEVP